MAASLDTTAKDSLTKAVAAQVRFDDAKRESNEERLRFMRDALAAGWPWSRMAAGLGITEAGVRRFWIAHRHEVGRLGERRATTDHGLAGAAPVANPD